MRPRSLLLLSLAPAIFVSDMAGAQENVIDSALLLDRMEHLSSALNTTWVLVAAALVLFMQVGFMMLEAGAVRTKNAVSVAQKNLLDIAFATLAFAAVGYMFAYGRSLPGGFVGWDMDLVLLNQIPQQDIVFFVFQVMFCGTAATIVSGAVAERMRLRAYIVLSVILALVIYPVFTHWAWGNALGPSSSAFLANAGFVNFAGSTVVHSTGGWMALACILVVGARVGRFDEDHPIRFGGHSAVLSSAGALILFVGWIGFNGGSTLAASAAVPGIILNTVLAAAAGGAAGYGLNWWRGVLRPDLAINGMIGALVAITAGCHLVTPLGALALGAAGGLCANIANDFIERRLRLDDAVGAVGVHGVAGIVGTLGLALVAPVDALPLESRLDQLAIQAAGAGLNFVWAFGSGLLVILLAQPFVKMRVTRADEAVGLNESEHGVRMGTGHIEQILDRFAKSFAPRPTHFPIEPGEDTEDLTRKLNALMTRLQETEAERQKSIIDARNRDEADRFAVFGEVTAEAILLIHEGVIASANAAAETLFGTDRKALVGRTVETLSHDNQLEGLHGQLADANGTLHQIRLTSDDGRVVPVEARARTANMEGRQIVILGLSDLSEKVAAHKRIFHLALHDPLTDLPNRELFNRRLEDALGAAASSTTSALLLVDVDKFKDINDIHGHPSGDAVLVAIAERLQSCLRTADTVARLGGDEFALIQTGVSFDNQAADLAHRALHAIAQPLRLPSGTTIRPRASIGVALFGSNGIDAETVLQNADLALYAVKEAGRNGFKIFEEGMGQALRLRQEMEADLSQAIERGELKLFLQPRIDLASGRIASYEALIRWHRGDAFISPADFIPVAETSSLIVDIGAWVMKEACRVAAHDFRHAGISVNVSPRQFLDPDLLPMISQTLADTGLDASRLELEITEGVLIDDDKRALQILSRLRDIGVRVALDDFGTGYSSLSYLTRFSFDTIKIDRSFIQSTDEKAWHVIRSVLSMSRGLDASVVAEGVETIDQLDRLAHEGCNEIQGFYIARPAPVSETTRELPPELQKVLARAKAAKRQPSLVA